MNNIFTVLLGLLMYIPIQAQEFPGYQGEEKAIMEVLEKETQSFFMGEYLDWASCWEHNDEIYFEWIRSNVHHFYTSWEDLNNVMRPIVAENVSKKDVYYAIRNSVRIYLNGNLAWVSYQQDMSGDKSNEQRLLRKSDGVWKIIMVTVVAPETFPNFNAH